MVAEIPSKERFRLDLLIYLSENEVRYFSNYLNSCYANMSSYPSKYTPGLLGELFIVGKLKETEAVTSMQVSRAAYSNLAGPDMPWEKGKIKQRGNLIQWTAGIEKREKEKRKIGTKEKHTLSWKSEPK